MTRLNQVNIKQEEDDEQKEVSVENEEKQQNNKGTLSRHDNTSHSNIYIKQEFDDEHKEVKNIAQQQNSIRRCTKVKKEEEGGECKVEWDGDECDCDQCRVEREVKIEFGQNNATNNQQANSCGPSQANKVGLCKRVKKEEDESGQLKDEWDEDCDCDDCRRMRLKAIRLEQTNVLENGGTGGEDGEETEIDEDGDGDEDVLVGNANANMAVDGQIGDEDGDELNQEGEQSGDGQESSEDQISDGDDETEIDDEEYEMEVDGDDEQTEQFGYYPIHGDLQSNGQIVQIEEKEEGDVETEVEDNEGDEEESRTESRIKTTLPHSNGQIRKIVRQSARHLKRKQTEDEIATECTNPIQPNRHLQCPHCLKSFDCNSHLEVHFRVHTGERPFACDQCEKRYKERNKLTRHQLVHQNIKRFRCPECEKQFTRKDCLDTHLLMHSGERRFACRHCEKSFTKSCNRNTHEQAIHLQVKSYRCKQCAHTATNRSHVIQHIRVVHFGLPATIKQQRALNIVDDRDPRELVEKV